MIVSVFIIILIIIFYGAYYLYNKSRPVDCVVSDWILGDCIQDITDNKFKVTNQKSIIIQSKNGGKACPSVLKETLPCNPECSKCVMENGLKACNNPDICKSVCSSTLPSNIYDWGRDTLANVCPSTDTEKKCKFFCQSFPNSCGYECRSLCGTTYLNSSCNASYYPFNKCKIEDTPINSDGKTFKYFAYRDDNVTNITTCNQEADKKFGSNNYTINNNNTITINDTFTINAFSIGK